MVKLAAPLSFSGRAARVGEERPGRSRSVPAPLLPPQSPRRAGFGPRSPQTIDPVVCDLSSGALITRRLSEMHRVVRGRAHGTKGTFQMAPCQGAS
ncbi:hypothetical protein AAFF_G00163710 [Aldrovandia affinis]|uniref:Uncharacterized protein n=1 Tax=Aldrovandia affinis TaxID=143900 RepID=A0AAD7SZH4_9TELE|nr:hypothetical protein AAFF_G00163710 [Aldrovandia affinis]